MQVTTGIVLAAGDELKGTPDQLAAAILKVVGGNVKTDYCSVNVTALPAPPGSAGAPPEPPEPEPPTEEDP